MRSASMSKFARIPVLVSLWALGLAGCSAGYSYLPVKPAEALAEAEAVRPRGLAPAASLLADCAGVQMSEHLIQVACDNAQEIYVARYDTEASAESCHRIATDVYRGASIAPGPTLRLPPGAIVHRIDFAMEGEAMAPSPVVACMPAQRGGLVFLTAQGPVRFDSTFYTEAIPAIAYDGVPEQIITSRTPDSVDFFGRALPVHSSCQLMGPRNLACYPSGQMSWSPFSSMEVAQVTQDRHIQHAVEGKAKVLQDETLPCTFEGVPAQCRRSVYRMPVPRLLTFGASNVLVTYYVSAEVRGQQAQAVCSFYNDQAPEGELAALCAEVLDLAP